MRRSALLLVPVSLIALALAATLYRRGAARGARPVPLGQTVEQALPDAEGKPQTWRLSRRTVPREQLPDLVLPAPAPRETAPDEKTESARSLGGQALEAWKHGEIRRALELFEAAIAADPDDALAHSDYGRMLLLMADHEAALPHLERAAELRPDDPRVWLDLLTLYERNVLLERAFYARRKAEALAGGTRIVRDDTGFWVLEGGSVLP